MIFGFNTDVKHGDTVYHVQSEAREGELLLQTQVFVRGRCIGKRATSYADKASAADFTDQKKEQILRDQHRLVLDAIRDGKLDDIFDKRDSPETLASIKELDVWVNPESVVSDGLTLALRVTDGGTAAEGAQLIARFSGPDSAPTYTQAITDTAGNAQMEIKAAEASLAESSILVQASYSGRTATRKFQLRRVEA